MENYSVYSLRILYGIFIRECHNFPFLSMHRYVLAMRPSQQSSRARGTGLYWFSKTIMG